MFAYLRLYLLIYLPQFEDRRKLKNEKINGWVDDTESVSPLDDLFSLLVPMLVMEVISFFLSLLSFGHIKESSLKCLFQVEGMNLPPESWEHLPPPLLNAPVVADTERSWVLPVLSDFMCDKRNLRTVSPQDGLADPLLILDDDTRNAFADNPLSPLGLDKHISFLGRELLNKPPVTDQLPFDVSAHPQVFLKLFVSITRIVCSD